MDIFVTVLQNDGGSLEAGITCASLALADAGIEMYDMVAACSVVSELAWAFFFALLFN